MKENFQQLQIKRRSIRKYTPELLTSDETKLILELHFFRPHLRIRILGTLLQLKIKIH